MKTEINLHPAERSLRIVGGFITIVFSLWHMSPFVFLGMLLWTTGMMGNCPAYSLFGINTDKLGAAKQEKTSGHSNISRHAA